MAENRVPALWLKQPWPRLLCEGHEYPGGKRVENRTWPMPAKYIGQWCLIGASKAPATAGDLRAARKCLCALGMSGEQLAWLEAPIFKHNCDGAMVPAYGGLVGAVKWADCIKYPGQLLVRPGGVWGFGPYCWQTTEATPYLPFVPWTGQQGFFKVPLSELPAEYRDVFADEGMGE